MAKVEHIELAMPISRLTRVVLLIIAYSKKDKDDVSPAQAKVIKRLIVEVDKYLASTHYRWTGTT